MKKITLILSLIAGLYSCTQQSFSEEPISEKQKEIWRAEDKDTFWDPEPFEAPSSGEKISKVHERVGDNIVIINNDTFRSKKPIIVRKNDSINKNNIQMEGNGNKIIIHNN